MVGMGQDQPFDAAVEQFLNATNMSPVTFGRRALNDPHFVGQLRNGRRLWPETEARVRHFMATYSPDNMAKAS